VKTIEKPKSKKQVKQELQQEAVERLLSLFEGDANPKVYTIIRNVSRSGMSRDISLKYVKGGFLYDLTYFAALALDWRLVEGGQRSIRVQGCGMDMGFHLVSTLSRVLYGDDYRLRHDWA